MLCEDGGLLLTCANCVQLAAAGPGCDLVSPMSTIRGKGWRPREGIEKMLKLSPLARAWTTRPQNFDRIQAVLSAVPAVRDTLVRDTAKIHNMSFSGA